jgi:hypothetical protein
MVAVEIAKCYYSAIAIVEAKGPCGHERVSREALWWERPEGGCRCGKESKADDEEEEREASWRTETSTEEVAHGFTVSTLDRAESDLTRAGGVAYEISTAITLNDRTSHNSS